MIFKIIRIHKWFRNNSKETICLFLSLLLGLTALYSSPELDTLESLIRSNLWDNPNQAQEYAQTYNDLAQEGVDLQLKAKGANFTGMTYHVKGDLVNAIENYLQAYDYSKQTDDKRYGAILLNNIGAAYKARDKTEETKRYYKDALTIFEEINDTLWIGNVTNNLAILLNAEDELEEAEEYFLRAKERYEQLDDSTSLKTLSVNMASLYFDMNQYDQAKENINYYLGSDPPTNDLYVYCKHLLAKIAIQKDDLQNAADILNETLAITAEKGYAEPALNANKLNYDLLKRQGKFRAALTAHEHYITMKDSLFNKEKDAQLTEMLNKYEAKEKEAEILRLNLEDDLNQVRISRQRMALGGSAIGLGLLSFLLYRIFGQKKQIESQNEVISNALSEKETLLKEIHHRVKNNMQVISSLLRIQSNQTQDAGALEALKEGQSRVQSMSLIHQDLYQHDNLTGIHMPDYIEKLGHSLLQTYQLSPDQVSMASEVDELTLDVDTVVPLGLIINELVTNSLKYAFPDGRKGKILVSLIKLDDQLKLMVKDNGIGLTNEDHAMGFGSGLIKAFARKLDADLSTTDDSGLQVTLLIKDYQLADG